MVLHLSFYLLWVKQWSKKTLFSHIWGRFGRNPGSTYTSTSPKVCVTLGKMDDQSLKPVTCDRWSTFTGIPVGSRTAFLVT